MAAVLTWYYRTDAGVVGPILSAELKRLLEQGAVRDTTLIRRGEDGSWFPSEGILVELAPAGHPAAPAGARSDAAEWYFSLQGKRKLGPVTWSVLAEMRKRGKLTAADLVWKPGMAAGVPASEIPWLPQAVESVPVAGPPKPTAPPPHAGADKPPATPPLAGPQKPTAPPPYAGADKPALPPPFSGIPIQPGLPPPSRPVEPRPGGFVSRLTRQPILFGGIAVGIVVLGLISTASWVLLRAGPNHVARGANDQSWARSTVPGRAPSARPKSNASSAARPKGKAEQHHDSLVRSPLRKGQSRDNGQSQQTLATNRTMLPPGSSTALAPRAKANPHPKQARNQVQANDQPQPDSSRSAPITLETVLAAPRRFTGKTITTDGLYKIGTHAKTVKGPDGKPVGWALPVARTDGSTICSGEAKVLGHDTYLLLQDGFAPFLDGVFRKLGFQITLKPLQRCILTVAVRSQMVAGKDTAVVDITGLEILGACNLRMLVERQYNTAFIIVRIARDDATVEHGNGPMWVALLGGEENFVMPIRHKVREMQRRLVNLRETASIDRYLQAELSRVIMMSNFARQQQTRMFEALVGQRITP